MSPARFLPIVALGAALIAPLAAGAQTTTPVRLPAPVFSNPNGTRTAYPIGRPAYGGSRESLFLRTVQQLNLSPGQRQQVQNLVAQRRAENVRFPRGSAERRANNRRMRDQIRGLLNPQQRSMLGQRLRVERQQRRGTRNLNGSL